MKTFFLIILILLCQNVHAQSSRDPYIYDSKLDIAHIKLMEYPNSKLFFQGYKQGIDTSGNHKNDYLTTIKFQVTGALLNRIITLKFDNPVISCELKCPHGVSHITTITNKDKSGYRFVINKLNVEEFSFIIVSKEKIFAKIFDVSKYITP